MDSKNNLFRQVFNLITRLDEKEKQDVLNLLKAEKKGIPISAFKARLSGLEIIVKYLKEVENKPFKEISGILNRKLSTLYNTYRKSKIKFKKELDVSDDSITIPYEIFADRKYSVLESIVDFLKDTRKCSFTQISLMLNKKYSTIKTVCRRYKIKNGQ